MSDKPTSNIPGRITAPPELLEPAIAELLRRIPETWEEYKPDDLTEAQSQALFLLTAAEMVERRERLRVAMADHPVAAEATITFTGEYGGVEALEHVAANLWDDWEEIFRAWKENDAAGSPSTRCERLERSEWRLTPEGVLARRDLDGGADGVLNYVLKRGLFDGQIRMIGGRIIQRVPMRGKGELVRLRKYRDKDAGAVTVHIDNWAEGADAFAKAFADLAAMTRPQPAPSPDQTGETADAKRTGKGRENLRSWTQEDLDKAILQYKAARSASYADLREGIKRNRPVARKAALEVYGRNAIARALGVKSPSMVSKSPAWIAIANELGLELRRGKPLGTRHTGKRGRIGYDIALERKSATPASGDDNAPADEALESAERQETIRQINRLARSGRTAKEKADRQRAAEDLLRRLQCEECTDDRARQVVEMILNDDE